tara:strand:+ start:1202 stop:1654 length:453 start_codon:yes stop_codon:yes gene_type:complete
MGWSKDGKGGSVISFKGRTRASAIARRGPLRRTEKHVQAKVGIASIERVLTKYSGQIHSIADLMVKIRDELVANNDVAFNSGVSERTVNALSQTKHLGGENGKYHFTNRTNQRNGEADDKQGMANKSPNVNPAKAPAYKKKQLNKIKLKK